VFIIRGGNVVASATDIVPQGMTGLVEVNHPGGGSWLGNTPYLQAGDVMETKAKDAAGRVIAIDQTTMAKVTAQRPVQTAAGTVEIHGTAAAADGSPLPIDKMENRLITSSANPFALGGKRTLRAASVVGGNVRAS